MSLPADILGAISAPGGGKVSIVMGAGCSYEAPTNLPLARQCSEAVHARLIADGVLATGECTNPSDLSNLADVVFAKTGSQRAVVERMVNGHQFKTPTPNVGYEIAAALLLEGKLTAVVTLNFDLAMTAALASLGAGAEIAVIDGPHGLAEQSTRNVYYLHRNANATNPDDWVLRSTVIEDSWGTTWQGPVTTKALTVPVVVFAGLGSPAAVLLTTTKLIHTSTPNTAKCFQVDPGDPAHCEFFKALGLPDDQYVRLGWGAFMALLAERVMEAQLVALRAAVAELAKANALSTEDLSPTVTWLRNVGLVEFGRLRSKLLCRDASYLPDRDVDRALIGDLLHFVSAVERLAGVNARFSVDGVIEFYRGDRVVSAYMLASGSGTLGRVAIEAKVRARMDRLKARHVKPTAAIVAGSPGWTTPLAAPVDITVGDPSKSLITSAASFPLFEVSGLRASDARLKEVAP